MEWNFESDLGNIKPGIPFAIQLINDIDYVEIVGKLPTGLFLHQNGRIVGSADWSANFKSYQFSLNAIKKDQSVLRNFSLEVNSQKEHTFTIVLTSGYESSVNKPWT